MANSLVVTAIIARPQPIGDIEDPRPVPIATIAPEFSDTDVVEGTIVLDQHEKAVEALNAKIHFLYMFKLPNRHFLRVNKTLPEGMWSCNYVVQDINEGTPCALKVIPMGGSHTKGVFADIEVLKHLKHLNIMSYHEHFLHHLNDHSYLCIKMDLCAKGSLEQYLRHRGSLGLKLSTASVCDFLAQLLSALQYLHDQGILHGDLQPGNIMCTKGHQLKITNFGSSLRIQRNSTAPLTFTGGARAYAPPEWAESTVPHRSLQPLEVPLASYDMWSLGCILSELATMKLLPSDRLSGASSLGELPSSLEALQHELAVIHSGRFAALSRGLLHCDPMDRLTANEATRLLDVKQAETSSSLGRLLGRKIGSIYRPSFVSLLHCSP